MNALETTLSQPVVERLGWMLVHFVWQGAAVALTLAVLLVLLRHRSANSRYVVACAALLAMVLLPVQTFFMLPARSTTPPSAPTSEGAMLASAYPVDSNWDWRTEVLSPRFPSVPDAEHTSPGGSDNRVRPVYVNVKTEEPRTGEFIGPYTIPPHRSAPSAAPIQEPPPPRLKALLPWIVCAWLVGVFILSVRLLGGWLQANRLTRRSAKTAGEQWQKTLQRLMRQMRVSPPVRLLESAVAQAPTAIGWLRPVILLPASALTGLTPRQLEAILAHELAHVRRHDYLVNLLQTVVETLLFYHPAVWWVSQRIRAEREHCCDDLAVSVCGDAVTYARALAELEQLRSVPPQPAVAVSGGSLLNRIRRLVGIRPHCASRCGRWTAGVFAILGFLLIVSAIYLCGRVAARGGQTERASVRAESGGSYGPGEVVPVPAWNSHVADSETRIAVLVGKQSYQDAALLSERLLGDYGRALDYLLRQWERVESVEDVYSRWIVATRLAHCFAHLGRFEEAQTWIARAREISPDRNRHLETQAGELARCREWVPRRETRKKQYEETRSFENARALLRAYARLDEYANMKRLIEEMEARFPKHRWLASEEFQSLRRFVAAYVAVADRTSRSREPATVPARKAEIEAVFRDLHANWEARSEFARAKWDGMSAIEKAKMWNQYYYQKPPRGFNWEPTEEEAAAFLKAQERMLREHAGDRDILDRAYRLVGQRLSKDETAPFDNEEASLIGTLALMGEAAMPDLLAKIQQAPWDSRAGREAAWAQKALAQMGDSAAPALSREIGEALRSDPSGNQENLRMMNLVRAVVAIGTTETVPTLRRVLESENRSVRLDAIRGLERLPNGLTQQALLRLWEDPDDYVRKEAARLLGQRGDAQVIPVLERDIPTAYAEARYHAEAAVWQIKKRLGVDPGARPERPRSSKIDTSPLWEGIEKSLESPNPGIRMTAIKRMGERARTPDALEPLVRILRDDPDKTVRAQAARSLAWGFNQSVRELTSPTEFAAAFDALAKTIAEDDEDVAAAAMDAGFLRRFKDRPGFERIAKRVLDGMDSADVAFRAQCMYSFVRLFYDDVQMLQECVTPARRKSISKAVREGLASDYGRYAVDAISAAEMLGLTGATPPLVRLVDESSKDHLRAYAARALGKIGDARAITALETTAYTDPAVDSRGFYVNREMAWQALIAIQGRTGAAERNSTSATEDTDPSAAPLETGEIEKRIAGAADRNACEQAARFCERLLGDYKRAQTYWLRRWDALQKGSVGSAKWNVCTQLARCLAHQGDFEQASVWLDRATVNLPSRHYSNRQLEREIAQCRQWVPRRDAAGKTYAQNPSIENARALLRAHERLDEYASMRRLVAEMERRFAGHPWLQTNEFQSIRRFVTAYVALPQPPSKRQGPAIVPARNPQIERTFEKLEANWQKRLDFAQAKWSRMSTIEKARYINMNASSIGPKGPEWNPTQEEAEAFLRERMRGFSVRDGVRLTQEEALPFDKEESSLMAALAAMGEAAIPDLLAKIQEAHWDYLAGREAVRARWALGRMGGVAIPALSREIEKTLQTDPTGRRQGMKMRYLVRALAVNPSPEAIPALRPALEFPDRSVREGAIDGLRNIPGGLTQDMLIQLWEDSDAYIRRMAARLLGDRGDREAIEVLERDIPTAYADARYQAEYAVWQIRKRLGQDAGEPPERVRHSTLDPAPLYKGIEKSLQSPNKGIRATARGHLGMNVWTPRELEPLIRTMEDDSDEATRLQAAGSLATAFCQAVRKTTDPLQFASAFDALAKAIADGEEKTTLLALGAADFFGPFKDRPGFDGVVKRVLDGMDSPSTAFRAECLHAFARLLYDDPERMRRYVTPAGRQSIARAIMAGFPADYGRYLADAMQIARLVGITEATPGLIEIAGTHPEAHIRLDAARTLGEIGDARAIPALERMASSDPFVDSQGFYVNRETAWQALKTLREKSGAGSSAGSEAGDSTAHVEQAEKIIAQAVDSKDYEKAARLCEHLLGDFERAGGYLLQRWERLEKTNATFPKWGVCRKLALCNAHAGDFDAAQSWLDRMRELIPSRSLWPWERELALCKTWVPRREAAGKSYAQDSSLKNARDLLNVYEQLDEFAAMRRLVEEMENRFGADPWVQSVEFHSIADFVKGYAVLPKPQTKPSEPQVIPAKDPRIDAVLDKLEANRNRQLDFAWAKWSRMSAIEKAKYINLHERQQTAKGARWEPTHEEAIAFLRARKVTDQPGPEERERLRGMGVYDGASLTKEEKRPFEQEESSLVAELAAMGEAAIPDLLAKMQPGFWRRPTRASLEAGWAQMALGRMGNVAVPVLEREIEKVLRGQSGGARPGVLMKYFVNALASIGTAEAIPALRRSLDFSDRSVQYDTIRGLGRIPGGLTQELLLELWETCNDYNRQMVANLLGERGDRQALAILERDVPTAYANARYQAEYAIWRIKSRLGMEAGERPEPIPRTKKGDTAQLWEGIEKSVESPNKAIRATAFKHLERKARTPQDLEPLLRAMKTDPDRATRALAAGSLAAAFNESVRNTTAPLQFAEAFDALADTIGNGEEAVAIAGLAASSSLGSFKDRPGYDGIVRRALDSMDSPSTAVRAQCLSAFARMSSYDPELMRRHVGLADRKSIVGAVMAGLPTDYGRYMIDAMSVARVVGITEAIPNLIEIAGTHPDPYRRRDAAGTLGAIGDARAIPALEHMASSDPFVDFQGLHSNREAAWQAIKTIRERIGNALDSQ